MLRALAALLVLAFVLHVAGYAFVTLVTDTARDVGEAWRIAHGEALPLRGPSIGQRWSLGPAWFYLLAPIAGLAPLAVLPAAQRQGVGSALVREGLARCRAAGYAIVVVLGDPAYYSRFGFVDAAGHQVGCEYDAPPGAFQLIELQAPALRERPAIARYRPEFADF